MQAAVSAPTFADHVVDGTDPTVLNSIWSPECGVARYDRQIGALLQGWLDTLPADKLPKARLSLRVNQVREAVTAVLADYGLANDPCGQMLVNDINALAQFFAGIMKVTKINLRLDVVSNNACRKFHQDNVSARLLCTYRGRGTEYCTCLTGPEPEDICELPRGAVGLFKGRRWSSGTPSVIYHRSPQIEGSGETRLLLVIDAATCDDNCGC